jgi:hypothetical protein
LFTPDGESWRAVPARVISGRKPYLPAILVRQALKKHGEPSEISTDLAQSTTIIHEVVFGLVMPSEARQIAQYMREHNITRMFDPVAGLGALLALMHVFGGLPKDSLLGQDLRPDPHQIWPVKQGDALAYKNYAQPNTLTVLAWTDNQHGEAVQLSERLIPIMYEQGASHLLVLSEAPGCAISEDGTIMLHKYYRCEKVVGVFKVTSGAADWMRSLGGVMNAELSAFSELLVEAMATTFDGVWQATYIYTRRSEPSEAASQHFAAKFNACKCIFDVHQASRLAIECASID